MGTTALHPAVGRKALATWSSLFSPPLFLPPSLLTPSLMASVLELPSTPGSPPATWDPRSGAILTLASAVPSLELPSTLVLPPAMLAPPPTVSPMATPPLISSASVARSPMELVLPFTQATLLATWDRPPLACLMATLMFLARGVLSPTELESPSTLAMLPAMSVPPPMVCLICSTARGALMLMLMLMPMDSTMACPTTGQLTPSSTCTARGALTPRLSPLLKLMPMLMLILTTDSTAMATAIPMLMDTTATPSGTTANKSEEDLNKSCDVEFCFLVDE